MCFQTPINPLIDANATGSFNNFEDSSIKWIKNILESNNMKAETFLKLMHNHESEI